MYTIIFLGNGIILHIVRFDPALHQPVYFFLAMLAFVELGVSVSGPTVLGIFLFGINNISFGGCLLQIFSMHSFTLMESGVLLAMSVDHFVAIYSPLRYTIILTILHISRMGVTIAFHGACVPTASSPEASALLQPQYPHTLLLPPLRSDQVALWRYPPQ